MLLAETLPGLSMMVQTPSEVVTSWDLQKMKTKGDYTAALKLIQNSSEHNLHKILQIAEEQYQTVKKSFCKRICSESNNTVHFLVKLTSMMLKSIKEGIEA